MQEMEECDQDIRYMSGYVSVNIYQSLFSSEYNYRINCALDRSSLSFDNSWTDFVRRKFTFPKSAKFKLEEIEDQLDKYGGWLYM